MPVFYPNQWDRDIHIWGGIELGNILAGCIAQESLTYQVLYSWLQAIFRVRLRTFPTDEKEAWYLVHCHPGSPTQLPVVDNMQPIAPSENRVSKGHYVVKLFIHLQPGIPPAFRGDTEVRLRVFNPRNRVPSRASSSNGTPDSASSTHRNSNFRHIVRKRDGRCRLSGTRPGYTWDGSNRVVNLNYTGFQAAHIFPLAFAHRSEPGLPGAETHFEIFRSCWTSEDNIYPQNAQSVADTPANGILLRADLHLFFDAYQFAFLVPLDGTIPPCPEVIRFNISAAPILSGHGPIPGRPWELLGPEPLAPSPLQPTQYQPMSTIEPINMNLLRSHLLYCIRLRVGGQGYAHH